MEQRRVNLLQLKMFLLVVRMSALTLLLSLLFVSMATAESTCQQEIPTELIRELWSSTRLLINKLPKEEISFSRLLPKFCTKCPEHGIGWLEIREVIDVYQSHVFSREVIQRLLPLHFGDLLYRLQHTLHHCVSSSEPSKRFNSIKKLEKKIKKKKDKWAMKAIAEFTFILRWIDEMAQHHVL